MRFFRLHGTSTALAVGLVLGLLATIQPPATRAQETTGGMTGTVTDQSGAAVPGVVVILTNTATGIRFTETTNTTGFYRFSQIPPGEGYQATFTAKGFAPLQIKDIFLAIGTVRTQNASLSVGAEAATVTVNASNQQVTLDTTDATVGNDLPPEALNELPVQQRNDPTALFTLQPGVNVNGSVAGARVDQNYVTLDGLDVNDFSNGNAVQNNSGPGVQSGFEGSIVGHAPVDSVEELHVGVAGNTADTGAASGGQFALVTKSGTNHFHGNINEYHRDASLVANSWFSNNSSPVVPRNHLIQNQFGGNIGGPLMRDKLFFFFNFNDSRIIDQVLVQRTVPLDTLRGDNPGGPMLGYINNTSATQPSVSYLNLTQVKALDPAGIGIPTAWLNGYTGRFPRSNNNITGDGVNSGGYSFNAPDNDYGVNYVGRADYNLSDTQKMFARFTITRENSVNNPNEFPGDPITDPTIDRSYAFVIGHTWVMGSNKTNRAVIGETVQKLDFPNDYNPDKSTFFTFGDGTGPALASSLYLNPAASARRIPIPMVGDDFSWTKGTHTFQFGGTFKDILAHTTNVIDYNTTELGMGGNVLALCGPPSCGSNPSLRPSDLNQSANLGNLAEYNWDEAFAFGLARIGEVSADFNYNKAGQALNQLTGDQRLYRYYQTQLYLQDTWKVTPSLTIDYGLNYQLFSVPYEIHGFESTEPFTFDQYFQDRVLQSGQGQSGPLAVPLIAYNLGGKGNGSGAPPLYKPEYRNIAPHVGFAWIPGFDKKMVINASGSVVYDRTVILAIQGIQDSDSYLFQQTSPLPQGISGDPYDSLATDPRLDSNNGISKVSIVALPTPNPPYEPFVSGGQPYGLQIGSAFNATIDPSLKTPYSIAYNFGLQRSLPGDMILKATYVGRLGRRLIAQADANQVLDFPDSTGKSTQTLAQAFSNVTLQMRNGATTATVAPQPWLEDVMLQGGAPPKGYNSYTAFLVDNWGPYVYRGDFGDTVWFLANTGAAYNVGSAAQFSENSFYGNKGFSSYNGLLLTLQKNLSHGVHYDFNYTFSHSVDNVSLFANAMGDTGIGGVGLVCDVVRPRECRANSDFDIRQYLTSDANYELPFGKGRMFANTTPGWVNEIIGAWDLSGIASWHTGTAWGTNSNAFVASYSNDAPGLLIGPKSAVATHLDKLQGGGVNIFANQAHAAAAYEGPIGFQIGPRNGLRGPSFFNMDLGLGKTFPIHGEGVNLKFRADAFNALNHPNFDVPAENGYNGLDQQDITSSTFGEISYTIAPPGNYNNGARVLQLALRLEF